MKSKAAYFGVFTALALIFSYVESLISIPFKVPGIKLGLANLVIVVVLYKMGTKEAYILAVIRVVLSGFLFGNLFSIIYSLAGGLLSLTAMVVLKNTKAFSLLGISAMGGVFHNVGQLLMAALVLESQSIWYYFPVLLISGLVTGILIGILAGEMLKRLNNIEM